MAEKEKQRTKKNQRKKARTHTTDLVILFYKSRHKVPTSFQTLSEVSGNQPEVSAAYVRDLGGKQVQRHQVGEPLNVAHAHVGEEPAVQIQAGQASQR